MIDLCEVRMASKGGRPPSRKTETTRVYKDQWHLIYWICEATNVESAELLEPIIKDQLASKYEQNRAKIELLQALRAEEERIKQSPLPSDPPPIPEPGSSSKRRRR